MDPRRVIFNPMYVLEVRPGCKRVDIERQAQALLSKLEVGIDVGPYLTPLGEFPRSEELIRAALEQLRDPEKRAFHELWAIVPPERLPAPQPGRRAPWPDARDCFGI